MPTSRVLVLSTVLSILWPKQMRQPVGPHEHISLAATNRAQTLLRSNGLLDGRSTIQYMTLEVFIYLILLRIDVLYL